LRHNLFTGNAVSFGFPFLFFCFPSFLFFLFLFYIFYKTIVVNPSQTAKVLLKTHRAKKRKRLIVFKNFKQKRTAKVLLKTRRAKQRKRLVNFNLKQI